MAGGKDDNQSWEKVYFFFNWVENYSALKRNEIPTQATTRINLEYITLSEKSQKQKGKYWGSTYTRYQE